MATILAAHRRAPRLIHPITSSRLLATAVSPSAAPSSSSSASSQPASTSEPLTHYRITLRRSAISLPANIKGTLVALGIHRRMQTVYHRHNPETAGKILRVKELVEVQNVPESAVRTKLEQKRERKSPRGFEVVGNRLREGVLKSA